MKLLTPESSSLEFIIVNENSDKSNLYYNMALKFKNKQRTYKYLIKKSLWNDFLKPLTVAYKGLNIGKTIWGYIISKDIIEFRTYSEIQGDE